jgi:hypothetical protein
MQELWPLVFRNPKFWDLGSEHPLG